MLVNEEYRGLVYPWGRKSPVGYGEPLEVAPGSGGCDLKCLAGSTTSTFGCSKRQTVGQLWTPA